MITNTSSIMGMSSILKELYIKNGRKVHVGMPFNKGRGLCGLSEYRYETSWHMENVTCLKCLKYYLSLEGINHTRGEIAQKQYNKLKYRKEFEKLTNE